MKRFFTAVVLTATLAALAFGAGQGEATDDGPIVLTHFVEISDRASSQIQSYDEMYLYQALEDKFQIDMVFSHPPQGQGDEQFNLMIAAGDLTDIITWDWLGIAGGPSKALEDETIIRLNEYLDGGKTPYLEAFYAEVPEALKQAVTDDGSHFMFPFGRPAINLRINGGPAIRKDWLEQVGLDTPETIEEWYVALTAFKENDMNGNGDPDDEIPLFSQGDQSIVDIFPMAWKVDKEFVIADGQMAYGPILPGYRDYLAEMAKWYEEGLIDPDYITNDSAARNAKMTNDRVGAIFAWMNGVLGRFNTQMSDHQSFDLVGVRWPVAPDGVSYSGNQTWVNFVSSGGSAISTTNKNIDISLAVLDYAYSEEGNILYNFGEEGVTYNMVGGEPVFTDLILSNPDGLAATNALAPYAHASTGIAAGFAQDPRYASQIRASIPQQAAAEIEWANSTDGILPPPLAPPADDVDRLARIMSEARTYVDEYSNRVILGLESIDSFDNFVDTLKQIGIEEAVEIMQTSYESYQSR